MKALIPQINITEIFEEPVEILDIRIGSLLISNYGYGNYTTRLSTIDQLVSTYGTPTLLNYKYWYQIYNALQYNIEGVSVIRPVKSDAKNYSMKLTSDDTIVNNIDNEKLYNPDIAQNLIYNQTLTDASIEVYNRFVQNTSDTAIAICNTETNFELPITDEKIKTIRDLNVYTYNDIFTSLNNKYVIEFYSHEIPTGKIFDHEGVSNTHLVVDGNTTYMLPLETIKLTDDTPQTLLRDITSISYNGLRNEDIEVGFDYDFVNGDNSGVEPPLGAKVVGGTSGTIGYIQKITLDSGTWAGGDAAGTMIIKNVDGDFVIDEDMEVDDSGNVDFNIDSTAIPTTRTPYIILIGDHQYLEVNEIVNLSDDTTNYQVQTIEYNGTLNVTTLTIDKTVDAWNELTNESTLIIESDTTSIIIDSTFTPSFPVTLTYLSRDWNNVDYGLGGVTGSLLENASDGECYDYNTTLSKWEINTDTIITDTYIYIKEENIVYFYDITYTQTALTVREMSSYIALKSVYVESLYNEDVVTFQDIFDVKPNFLDDEFALAVFKKNSNGLFELKETYVLKYDETNEIFVNTNSNNIYLKMNTNVDDADRVDTGNYSIVDLTVQVNETINYDDIDYYTYEEINNSLQDYLNVDVNNFDYLIGFRVNIDDTIYNMDIMTTIAEKRGDCISINSVWVEDDYFGLSESEVTTKLIEDFGNTKIQSTSEIKKFSQFSAFFANMKLQYDAYNEQYVWLPLNGDIAGMFDFNRDDTGVGFQNEISNTNKTLLNVVNVQNKKLLNSNGLNNVTYNNLQSVIVFDSITTTRDNNSIFRELHKRKFLNTMKTDLRLFFTTQLLTLLTQDKQSFIEDRLNIYFYNLQQKGIVNSGYNISINVISSTINVNLQFSFVDILRVVNIKVLVSDNNIEIQEL